MSKKYMLADDFESEFDVDEPESMLSDNSDSDEWVPSVVSVIYTLCQ